MFDIINHSLTADVADNGTFSVNYATGRGAGSYAASRKHKLFVNQTLFESPTDFTVSFGATSATVTWLGDTTLAAGSAVSLQFDRVGDDSNQPDSNPLNDLIIKAPTYLLDLGSPATADADGVAASQSVSASANFTINGALASGGKVVFDTPRNVVAAWTGTAVLTITGKDVDGNTVVEKSASGTSHTGSKAFASISSVSSSASITSATVGSGNKVGLPARVFNASQILAEYRNGVALGRRPGKVYVQGHALEAAVDAATGLNFLSPVAGNISKMSVVARDTITTGGAVTLEVNTVAVTGLSVTVADGATEGSVASDTPTAGHATTAVAVGDRLEVQFGSAINASSDLFIIIEIDVTGAGQLDGTLVAAVDSTATAITGDTRGTYTPSVTPDGTYSYQLLAVLADPSDRGVEQYTG